MERIKKTILQIMKAGETVPCSHRDPETGAIIIGCTATTRTIIPDLDAVYYFKIGIAGVVKNVGFLDAYVEPPPPPVPPEPPSETTYYYLDNDGDVFQDKDGAYFIYQ